MNIDKAIQSAFKCYQEGKLQQAKVICEKVLVEKPTDFNVLHLLGIIYYGIGDYAVSAEYIREALHRSPNVAEAHFNLGASLKKQGQYEEAIACYRKALTINSAFPEALCNLGVIFQEQGYYEEAIMHYRKALQINPTFVDVLVNLGTSLTEIGKAQEAEQYYRYALRINPDFVPCYSSILFTMHFTAGYDPHTIFMEHLKFAEQYEQPLLAGITSYDNQRLPNRKLRIGYLSPDFRRHSVAYFFEPVLIHHNREQFEVFCYSNVLDEDEVTKRIRERTDHWRTIAGIADHEVARLIRRDNIDILIDLAGHTANNRVLVFARKPAPMQVSWLGYPATTGLSSIDYRIADKHTDPVGMTERFHSERLSRLPECFLSYLPEPDSPQITQPPSLTSGLVTFGSFNNFAKVSSTILCLWIQILKKIPKARLIIKAKCFADKMICRNLIELFTRDGISMDRIELFSQMPSVREHLDLYNRVDIGLDTFPYHGTTTTCEALWMGVPVVTLAGESHVSRVGVSLLSNVGLPELIASTSDDYVAIAVNIANDLERLQSLRNCLRDTMINSPVCATKRFTANIEMCYRAMWETWCRNEGNISNV